MEKMNRLGKHVHLLAVMTLASVGMMTPAIANPDITISQDSLKLAQASPSPSPMNSPATSPSPTRRPTAAPSPRRRPTAAPRPTSSPTPTASPSPTSSPAATTNQNLCRQVVKPSQGLVIRREPSIKAPVVGRVAYQGKVTLTTNPPTTRTADGRDWVEISAPAKGWVSHSLLTEKTSNLAYCQ